MLRVPCHIGGEVWRWLPPRRPYGVEVIADPWDVSRPGRSGTCCARSSDVVHPAPALATRRGLRGRLRDRAGPSASVPARSGRVRRPTRMSSWVRILRGRCSHAAFERPPAAPLRRHAGPALQGARRAARGVRPCAHQGLDVRLCLVGDGKHRPELERRAAALGVSERIEFRGQLASCELVRQELDRADLFVLPSRQEGLPRAMIEAMARGLPCIGSTVGGIPDCCRIRSRAAGRRAPAGPHDPERGQRSRPDGPDVGAESREGPGICPRAARTAAWPLLRARADPDPGVAEGEGRRAVRRHVWGVGLALAFLIVSAAGSAPALTVSVSPSAAQYEESRTSFPIPSADGSGRSIRDAVALTWSIPRSRRAG